MLKMLLCKVKFYFKLKLCMVILLSPPLFFLIFCGGLANNKYEKKKNCNKFQSVFPFPGVFHFLWSLWLRRACLTHYSSPHLAINLREQLKPEWTFAWKKRCEAVSGLRNKNWTPDLFIFLILLNFWWTPLKES